MLNPENPAFNNIWQGFEATSINSNTDRAPQTIVSKTKQMVELLHAQIITPEIPLEYFKIYTLPFLQTAAEGADRVYGGIFMARTQPEEMNEAADFTNVVFSWMHYFEKSDLLPDGFSRKGVMQAPQTKDEYIDRLREIKITLPTILTGVTKDIVPFSNSRVLRTSAFLRVGSSIPLKFMETDKERKQQEDEVIAKFTEGLDLSL